jgi:hypothetical protein
MRLLAAALLVASACEGYPREMELRGFVLLGHELTAFQRCGVAMLWHYEENPSGGTRYPPPGAPPPRRCQAPDPPAGQGPTATYVEMRAWVSEEGRYGHRSMYEREVRPLELRFTCPDAPAGCTRPPPRTLLNE